MTAEDEQPKRSARRSAARTKPEVATADQTTAVSTRAARPPEEGAEAPGPRAGLPLGRIALGLILLAVGLGWLLQSLDVIEVPWDALLPVALIAVGAVLVVGSRTGRHSGLITTGVILTIVTALGAAIDVPLLGGAGQRVIAPQGVAELDPRYDLALGQMVIDLSELEVVADEQVDIRARVGLGELVVNLPPAILVQARARAGLGDVQILGEQASGFSPERTVGSCDRGRLIGGIDVPSGCIVLDLSVGMGSVKVNQ